MVKIAIVFHSGYGHTARQAAAVHQGADSVVGASATLYPVNELTEAHWAELNAADAIIFGAPTYMGNASADFKKFADASSKPWFAQAWRNKIAGGFTNSEVVNFSFQHCHPGQRAPMSRGREQFCGGVESEAADSPFRL
uniref:flavodoxin family protein n=1 Tax=Accumulibacter sp. TaxID=2053492 RepID=UPI00261200A9